MGSLVGRRALGERSVSGQRGRHESMAHFSIVFCVNAGISRRLEGTGNLAGVVIGSASTEVRRIIVRG